ncbi:C25 family cysteine peptidase [[Eubacterium] cellulosolvens]
MKRKNGKILYGVCIITLLVLISSFLTCTIGENKSTPFTTANHVTYAIWDLELTLNRPDKAMVLTFEQKQWQATVAVCAVPVFIGREAQTPLMFSDGSGEINAVIQYDTKAVTAWGSDAITASAKMATEYWSKAELVFAVNDYEEALWIVPSAAFIGAPILVSPTQSTLDSLGTKSVVVFGNMTFEVDNTLVLTSKQDAWEFQLELFDTKGVICNYVILTNPHDTDDEVDPNIKWSYQSPTSALLAAYRQGIIQTGDWSVDREAFEAVETATGPDIENYNKIIPTCTNLNRDSYELENFLQTNGHQPEYLAAVGGPYAVPNFVYDIHVDYYWPTKNPQKTQYPSSLAAYATLSQTIQADRYSKEDLAAGRMAGGNVFDISRQIMRSYFYREFLPGGEYYSTTPSGWEKKACFVDGHLINQPEPDSLYWDRNKPYYPYEGVQPEYVKAGLTTDYYLPKNISNPYDTNKSIDAIMQDTTNYAYFHFMPHGGMTSLRIEVGIDEVLGYQNDFLESSTIRALNYKAPTFIYATCCKGAVWMHDTGYEPSDFIHSSFIHAGAVAYIATPEIQSGCFWKEAPYAVSGEQAIEFWKNVFAGNTPIGKAFRDAKWKAHTTLDAKTPKPEDSSTHHVDCISYTLFGDPALEPYKPNKPFSTAKLMDFEVKIPELKPKSEFDVEVTAKDLEAGTVLPEANIKISFQGTELTGSSAKFTAPEAEGEYKITITITKDGYNSINSNVWLQSIKTTEDGKDGDDDNGGFLPGFEGFLLITAVASVILIYMANSKRRKTK